MATVTMTPGKTLRISRGGNTSVPYLVEYELNLATAATTKGSALAAADVITVIDLPAHTMVWGGGIEVLTAMSGSSTDATLDLGVTGVDADAFVDGFDLDGAAAGAYAAQPAAYQPIVIGGTADTLDILIASQTGTVTGGVLRVFAILQDIKDRYLGATTALKS